MKNFRAASTKYLFKGEHWLESSVISKILIHKEYRHFFKKLSCQAQFKLAIAVAIETELALLSLLPVYSLCETVYIASAKQGI